MNEDSRIDQFFSWVGKKDGGGKMQIKEKQKRKKKEVKYKVSNSILSNRRNFNANYPSPILLYITSLSWILITPCFVPPICHYFCFTQLRWFRITACFLMSLFTISVWISDLLINVIYFFIQQNWETLSILILKGFCSTTFLKRFPELRILRWQLFS